METQKEIEALLELHHRGLGGTTSKTVRADHAAGLLEKHLIASDAQQHLRPTELGFQVILRHVQERPNG